MSDFGTFAEGKRNPENPVLFLDVDGVLNNLDTFRAGYQLSQEKVLLLNKLPPCDIVISSCWRIGTYPHLVAAMWWLGCKKRVIGRTDRSWSVTDKTDGKPRSSLRGDEIAKWLSENGNPRYAIVDDDSDFLPEQKPYFVQTNFEKGGLTPEIVAALSVVLTREDESNAVL